VALVAVLMEVVVLLLLLQEATMPTEGYCAKVNGAVLLATAAVAAVLMAGEKLGAKKNQAILPPPATVTISDLLKSTSR
jgi:hypothetical protein